MVQPPRSGLGPPWLPVLGDEHQPPVVFSFKCNPTNVQRRTPTSGQGTVKISAVTKSRGKREEAAAGPWSSAVPKAGLAGGSERPRRRGKTDTNLGTALVTPKEDELRRGPASSMVFRCGYRVPPGPGPGQASDRRVSEGVHCLALSTALCPCPCSASLWRVPSSCVLDASPSLLAPSGCT